MGRRNLDECDADRIKKILLLGVEGDKRKIYFEKAVCEAGIDYEFCDWNNFLLLEKRKDLKQCIIKIDAPKWDSSILNDLDKLTNQYKKALFTLTEQPFGAYFNHPMDILELLDKRKCKQKLIQNGIPVTKPIFHTFSKSDELLSFMRGNQWRQVFIKPVTGSGAAGVSALRFVPTKNKIVLYTCAQLFENKLINTKRMHRLEQDKAVEFLDVLLKLDCIVEKWHRKSSCQSKDNDYIDNQYYFDLRVIVQDGRIDYILPRLSKGPITNLHLNNLSIPFNDLNLKKSTIDKLCDVCIKAAACYPRLNSVGLDVLLEKDSEKPYIIEMNAQGDLMHKDVYGDNIIYKRQIELINNIMLKSSLGL